MQHLLPESCCNTRVNSSQVGAQYLPGEKQEAAAQNYIMKTLIICIFIGNESSHEISNDTGVRVVNFATSKNLFVKSTMFPHRSIHK
jgi:hypothetical protein